MRSLQATLQPKILESIECIEANTKSTQEAAETVQSAAERLNTIQVTKTLQPEILESIKSTQAGLTEAVAKLKSELLDGIQKTNSLKQLAELKSELLDRIEKMNSLDELVELENRAALVAELTQREVGAIKQTVAKVRHCRRRYAYILTQCSSLG